MMLQPRFTDDLATLPTTAFSHRSLTWWGVLAFFLIEGSAFALAFASYFFLMNHEQGWPPPPWSPPDLLAGTLFTIVMLLSEIPNSMLKHAAEHGQLKKVRAGLLIIVAIGVLLMVLRIFEFASLNVLWTDNAYGSIMWALLVLHLAHFLTDWVDSCVLAALMHTEHGIEKRRFVDVSENAMYWRFVWLTWLPIYVMVYWLPRWIP
ncbi:MAG TPA: cytochrome c oxidase subunit 3 [Allosphingosinicella sp.]|nr:cytochrome c oxidase subunit 3 [Allosphingosinicella sp.]